MGRQLGLEDACSYLPAAPWQSRLVFLRGLPFADDGEPVALAVLDGTGDLGSISLRRRERRMRELYSNESMFDSLGMFYSVISSTQGGWTWLSSEGRYMGAAAGAHGPRQQSLLCAAEARAAPRRQRRGQANRAMANWQSLPATSLHAGADRDPRRAAPAGAIMDSGCGLRVEDIPTPDTNDRLDKAAATQLVLEDAMIHIVDHLLRTTGAHRLVLTGGVALNAIGNMRLLEHFDEAWFEKDQGRKARLHLWVPPVPAIRRRHRRRLAVRPLSGRLARRAGAHAFYCGVAPSTRRRDRRKRLKAEDVASDRIGDISTAGRPERHRRSHGLHAVAQNGVIAIHQGPAETGPRALGHRSILANPCRSPGARTPERAREISRGDPPAGAYGNAGGGAAVFRAAARRI